MRPSMIAVALVMFVVMLGSGCASSSGGKCPVMQPDGAKIDAAKKLDADLQAAFNRQDADALAACYWNSPDVVFYPPDEMECRGQKQLHDFFMNTIQSVPGAKLELARQKYTVAGDCVIGDGRFTMKPPGGEAMSGRFTEVFAKKDGKWVIIVDHASVPAAK